MVGAIVSAAPPADPAAHWRQLVEERVVPDAVRDQAPEPAWSLEPERFRWSPEEAEPRARRPAHARAMEALPDGGSVLDVGAGGGRSSLGLAPRAGLITGVDRLEGMLASFAASAQAMGVAYRTVLGDWPDVAGQVEPADVAVAHHAFYLVADLEPYLRAITERARHRVVLEALTRFPQSRLNPLWKAFHGIDRPDPPVADAVEALARSMGLAVEREDGSAPARVEEVSPETVAFARRRLYVGPERDAEIAEFLRQSPEPAHELVALWWPGGAGA